MRPLSRLVSLWRTLFHRDRLERELDDELRAAVDTLADRYATDGMSPKVARLRADAALGGVERVKRDVWNERVGARLDALLLDLRYAWRGVLKAPGFTAVIVVTLALGIGANTAMFSIVRSMLLQPLPYRDADRLIFVWLGRTEVGYRGPLSGPDLRDLRQGTTSFEDFGGIWASSTVTLTGDGDPEQLRAALVTSNFFDVLGATSALGRTFRAEDSGPGAEPSILLGWELFQRRFGADPAIVGRKIDVNDTRATVIGVMPQDFRLLLPADASVPDRLQAFVPFWPDLESGPRGNLFLRVVGRMRPGVPLAQARDDVARLAEETSRALGRRRALTAIGLQDDDVREIRGPLMALFGGVALLLLIACVNVASLLVARASSRTGEIALRLALGVSSGQLVRLFLVEGLLLTLLGGVAGAIVGYGGLRLLLALAPASLSRLETTRMDPAVFAFGLAVSIVAGLLFSLAPRAERIQGHAAGHPLQALRGSSAAAGRRIRTVLVGVQIALSVVLIVGAALLVRTFVEVLRVDPGFTADRLLTFRIAVPDRYDHGAAFNSFASELRQRLAALPGVTKVGAISHLPYDGMPNWSLLYSRETVLPPDSPNADTRAISPELFEMLGVELVAGRFFTEDDDDPRNPVAIVDERLARELWPGADPLLQQISTSVAGMNADIGAPTARLSVVGVVRHLRLRSLVEDFRPQLFLPWRIAQRNPVAVVVGTVRDQASLAADIRRAVAALDSRVAIYDVRPMQAYVTEARSMRGFTMMLAAAFALSALALTAVGVYGVLAYSVTRRRHEIGVRRALGETTGRTMRGIFREGMLVAAAGCACGLVVALLTARLLQGQLYLVHPRDPVAYGVAVALIFAVAALACWLPARRATIISPLDALRSG
jgi:predicted permease